MNLEQSNQKINPLYLEKAMSYADYISLLNHLFERGLTTGEKQSESLLEYAKINLQRMKRLDKTGKLLPELIEELKNLKNNQLWLVISEGWCGDAAQNLPFLNKIAEASPKIELQIILRDENLDLMDQFLTNGGRSIPKLIALNKQSLEVLGTWGPRPAVAQEMMMEFKKQEGADYSNFQRDMQIWYTQDKGQHLQREFIDLLKSWNS